MTTCFLNSNILIISKFIITFATYALISFFCEGKHTTNFTCLDRFYSGMITLEEHRFRLIFAWISFHTELRRFSVIKYLRYRKLAIANKGCWQWVLLLGAYHPFQYQVPTLKIINNSVFFLLMIFIYQTLWSVIFKVEQEKNMFDHLCGHESIFNAGF